MIPMRTTRACLVLIAGVLYFTGVAGAEDSDCPKGEDCKQAEARDKDKKSAQADCDTRQGCEPEGGKDKADGSTENMTVIVKSNCDIEDVCEQVKQKKSAGKSLTKASSTTQTQCGYKVSYSRCPLDQVIEHCYKKSTSKVLELCEE